VRGTDTTPGDELSPTSDADHRRFARVS